MARRDIEFDAEGVTLRGWFYPPEGARGPAPHDRDGPRLLRGQGDVPRPLRRGVRRGGARTRWSSTTAISAPATASPARRSTRGRRCGTTATPSPTPTTLPEVDADRIGVWGSSYSGGHVLVVGAIDRRVKAWSCAGAAGRRPQNFRRLVRAGLHRRIPGAVRRRPSGPLPRRSPGDGPRRRRGPARARRRCRRRTRRTWFTESHKTRAPSWRNEVTLRSVEMLSEYGPATYIAVHQPDPAAAAVPARTTSSRRPTWRSPRTRRRGSPRGS